MTFMFDFVFHSRYTIFIYKEKGKNWKKKSTVKVQIKDNYRENSGASPFTLAFTKFFFGASYCFYLKPLQHL